MMAEVVLECVDEGLKALVTKVFVALKACFLTV